MWSDNETDIDLLGFRHLRTAIISIATNDALLPATVGVFGDWGSGKTSLMRMVCSDLEQDPGTLVLWFNGWLFEGFDDAKTALMGSIIDEIIAKRSKWTQSKEKAGKLSLKLLKKIPIFRVLNIGSRAAMGYAAAGKAGAMASLSIDAGAVATDAVKAASEKIDSLTAEDVEAALKDEGEHSVRRNIREFHNDFAALLKETGVTRLVVFIDDLDRCIPDTIIETLEAIKLFLFAPNTVFVIGADERLVQYAVRRRFPELPGERVDVGQDYLEKLVQFAVRVPSLGRIEMETYINLLFCRKAIAAEQFEEARKKAIESPSSGITTVRFNHAEAAKAFDHLTPELAENLALSQRIAPFFAAQLTGNPRQCKRFLNLLLMRVAMAKSRGIELKQRVLAKLMLLERYRNQSFRHLADAQAAQAGKPKELVEAEQSIANTQAKTGETGKGRTKAKLSSDADAVSLPAWLNDDWIKAEWLVQEPKLGGENLGPYFYFSRDKLGGFATSAQRLSQAAQESLADLFADGDAVRSNALKKFASLSSGDASSVFDAVADRSREEDDSSDDDSALSVFCNLVEARPELVNQFLLAVGAMVPASLPVWLPQRVRQITKGTQHEANATGVFRRWAEQTQAGPFAKAIQAAIKP